VLFSTCIPKILISNLSHSTVCRVGRDNLTGDITTRYRLDGPGMESRWGRVFPQRSRPALGPAQSPTKLTPGSFPRVKRPEIGVDHPPPSSTEVKERVALFFYSPLGLRGLF
jgi:hypothetical protein